MYKEYMPNRYIEGDVGARLCDTFIRYDGRVVYVSESDTRRKTLTYVELPYAGTIKTVKWDDPKIDISSIELGYGNYSIKSNTKMENRVIYVYRNPQKRTYRQGVHQHSVSGEDLNGKLVQFGMTSYQDLGWVNLLNNKYPTPEEREKILKDFGEVAVSRELAVSVDRFGLSFIYVRGEKVAYRPPETDEIILRNFKNVWAVEKIIRKEFPECILCPVETKY